MQGDPRILPIQPERDQQFVSVPMTVRDRVVNLLHVNFPSLRESGLEDGDSFLEHGVIDSIGMMELVGLLDSTFGIRVSDDELMPENLDSIASICGFLQRKGVEI
jgi:acyl carrier protein